MPSSLYFFYKKFVTIRECFLLGEVFKVTPETGLNHLENYGSLDHERQFIFRIYMDVCIHGSTYIHINLEVPTIGRRKTSAIAIGGFGGRISRCCSLDGAHSLNKWKSFSVTCQTSKTSFTCDALSTKMSILSREFDLNLITLN